MNEAAKPQHIASHHVPIRYTAVSKSARQASRKARRPPPLPPKLKSGRERMPTPGEGIVKPSYLPPAPPGGNVDFITNAMSEGTEGGMSFRKGRPAKLVEKDEVSLRLTLVMWMLPLSYDHVPD